jgi:hypothetical protein
MDQSVMADHVPGVLLPLSGTVGQVVDIQTHMIGGEILYLNIACKLDK